MLLSLFVRSIFLLVGLLLLFLGAWHTWSTRRFLDDAATTEGTVVALDEFRSAGDDMLLRPVVVFTTDDGSSIEFTSSLGSDKPSHREGETVTVLYRPDDPTDAEIRGFGRLWFNSIFFGGLGSIFFVIGVAVVTMSGRPERPTARTPDGEETGRHRATRLERRDPSHLREDGIPIRASVTGVVTSAATATEPWWKLVAEGADPTGATRREFVSHRLPIDPLPHVVEDEVLIFVDPDDDEHYLIDLSFLDNERDSSRPPEVGG